MGNIAEDMNKCPEKMVVKRKWCEVRDGEISQSLPAAMGGRKKE